MRPTDSEAGDGPVIVPPNFVHLLEGIARGTNVDPELRSRISEVTDYLGRARDRDRPFLTVVVPTRGHRLEPLRDVLLCLLAQTSQDFEVILLGHDLDVGGPAGLRQVIADQPASFAERIRFEAVEGGTRAYALNVGIELARGRYVVICDDDHLLFAHWVEIFQRSADDSPGRLVRSVVAVQAVEPEDAAGSFDGFRALSWPSPDHPQTFDQLRHLLVNRSPVMSWAFPRQLFELYGVRFDAQLAVTDDWDLILQGSALCGVADAPELTAIDRRRSGAAVRQPVPSAEEWTAAEQRITERLDRDILLMSHGAMSELRRVVLYNNALQLHRRLFEGHRLRRPIDSLWQVATPGARLALRARNKLRRLLAR
jgi:hypothetical protein